ncbi:MAG: hypothetical protein Q8830_03215, partial [Candidatus Phytoplasma australasiaticum]|nr:hypothetical protein [Candidatus Phytoplasma australasiaticum]
IYPYINKATKLAFLFNDLDKQYQGTALFNKNYDTLDIYGELIMYLQHELQHPPKGTSVEIIYRICKPISHVK